ncbi:LLM class flavin-dependent oxidoreductase [Bordetella sp. BOR01]|uniref:LLM class flavin-dependent oxidoreductase n=1 Tax=Bordetella sp. BOR01 TaxID=2854779 RepID=UPI001C437C48|nr:LLM class flavin-dependent oxidoreductase [Bordetella sp. BOR01]MBV7481683.1 LLM class flavin-dependent oxidoreductase [Bordetella sp. BOR01]
MTTSKRTIRLGLFLLADGHHVAAWRRPGRRSNPATDFNHYLEIARQAETGYFDFLFVADFLGVRTTDPTAISRTARTLSLDPFTLLSALAATTQHIGLIGTASTTYNEPFHVARKFASLDIISQGRSGWNLVTSQNDPEAWNFGHESHAAHASRYDRASEFADVVLGLWDSWQAGAMRDDAATGIFLDPEGMKVLGHRGTHFSVRGPLDVAPSPQGRPIVVQAGSSDTGIALAVRTADIVFTAQPSAGTAKAFYAKVKARAAEAGRDPGSVLVMPGVAPVIGQSRSHAQELKDELDALVHPAVGHHLLYNATGGLDLLAYSPDSPLPDILPETNGSKSRQQVLLEVARRDKLTIRQLYLMLAGARGHRYVIGTAQDVADELEHMHRDEQADGFNIMPLTLPEGLGDFVREVVPELQRRHLVRTAYKGRHLRESLGLGAPHRVSPAA